jgi:hypothetical protein
MEWTYFGRESEVAGGEVSGGLGGPHTMPQRGLVMSTHASVLVDSVGPPSAEVCRAAASFP